MARTPSSRPDDDEEDEEEEEEPDEDDDEEPTPRRSSRHPPRRRRPRPRRPPVQRWRAAEDEEEEEVEDEVTPPAGATPGRRKAVYWRARDSLWFEPLVALAIIIVLLVGLFAYTQNWPPVYVVESNSMQHGSTDQLGLINAGDLVLAQKFPTSQITTYEAGLQTGYSTYGEAGDVLLYWPNGQSGTPIIHRAMLYLQWDPPNAYNASGLATQHCGTSSSDTWAYYAYLGASPTCSTTDLSGYLYLFHVGWNSQTVEVDLTPAVAPASLGDHSGFLTMGDNNSRPDQSGPSPLSSLVEPGWVIGVARGMIPWFGSLKLLLDGDAGQVPAQSWELMALTIVGIILVAFGVHYALRREGIETPLRREEDEESRAEAEAAAQAAASEPGPRGWLSRLRRRPTEEQEEEPPDTEVVTRRKTRPPPTRPPVRRGRPVPHVKKSERPKKKRPTHADDDEL